MNRRSTWLNVAAVGAVVVGLSLIIVKNAPRRAGDQLTNVSYDPTRELYQAINPRFVASYEKATGRHLVIVQSHGGSSRQSRKVVGAEQPADVVTFGSFSDIDALRKHGLIAEGWADRLPNHSLPYTSTIVFVVRRGNPHAIKDWPDLIAPGVEVVTPDPRTSSNGKLAVLAAWAAITTRGGSKADARTYLASLFQHVPVLDEAAIAAAGSFVDQEVGDVHLTWENQAIREVAKSKGRLQIVYPPVSILAEPYVAWVDRNVAQDGNLDAAKAYLGFLFGDEAQALIARSGFRPYRPEIAAKAGIIFHALTLMPISAVAPTWNDADAEFFGEDGIVTLILEARRR